MSISAIGNLPMTAMLASTAPVSNTSAVAPQEAIASEPAQPSDSLAAAAPEQSETPSLGQLRQLMHTEAAVEAEPQAEVATEVETSSVAGTPDFHSMSDSEIAAYCTDIARSDASVAERTELITAALSVGVEQMDNEQLASEGVDASWTKATPEQLQLYVQETLEHADSVRGIGELRGMDFSDHDLEVGTGKFEPKIAQFLALPGREDSVKWAIKAHNASPHHDIWNNPNSSKEELAESASDIVNAWRMNRRVYDKPSWSWERIADVANYQVENNQMNRAQYEAILEAIPYQMEYEANNGGVPA